MTSQAGFHKALYDCLLQAFNLNSLERMLLFEFGKQLTHIVPANSDFATVVFELIKVADQQGWLEQLVVAAKKTNPTNKCLQNLGGVGGITTEKPKSVFLTNYPYGLEGHFVGREAENEMLDEWFHNEPHHSLLAIIGLGGEGKSALTWQWMQRLRRTDSAPPLVVWWSFYETDGTLDKLLRTILEEVGVTVDQLRSLRQLYETFARVAQQMPILLVMDGAERILRAYGGMSAAYQGDGDDPTVQERARECIDPVGEQLLAWLAQPLGQTKTLLTSRLLPTALQGRSGGLLAGVRRYNLTGLSLPATRALFAGLGIEATRSEIQAVCQPLGYHPLSLRLLASWLAEDPRAQRDIRKAIRYDPRDKVTGKREHVLRQVFDTLPSEAQTLLGQLGAFRGAVNLDVIDDALKKQSQRSAWQKFTKWLSNKHRPFVIKQTTLDLLVKRGFVQRSDDATESTINYDLHPIVRRYAYTRLTNPTATHAQLASVFEAVETPSRIVAMADLRPTIELYHHLAQAGRFDEARTLYRNRLNKSLYYQLGAYQTCIALLRVLFVDGEGALPRLQDESAQAWTLNALANSYSLAGRPKSAILLFELHNQIYEKRDDKRNLAVGLGNVAIDQMKIGRFQDASHNLQRSITLCQEIENRFLEAMGHKELGRVWAQCGAWQKAEAVLATALELDSAENKVQSIGLSWLYRAEMALLRGHPHDAQAAAEQALHFAEENARKHYPIESAFVRCHWMLGWAALACAPQVTEPTATLTTAEHHLDEALHRCRAINFVMVEGQILLAQARLAIAQANTDHAIALLDEAERIAQRSGYVLVLADIYNERAALALNAGNHAAARDLAQRAYDYAWCDGPPYAYQPALDRANQLLAELAE